MSGAPCQIEPAHIRTSVPGFEGAPKTSMTGQPIPQQVIDTIRNNFKGSIILSGGYDLDRAEVALQHGKGDLIAFGRNFLANPDLPRLVDGCAGIVHLAAALSRDESRMREADVRDSHYAASMFR